MSDEVGREDLLSRIGAPNEVKKQASLSVDLRRTNHCSPVLRKSSV